MYKRVAIEAGICMPARISWISNYIKRICDELIILSGGHPHPVLTYTKKSLRGITRKNFFALLHGVTFGGPPGATVKNSDTLWRFSKNFKFLKEVKILSEFFPQHIGMPNANMRQAEGGHKSYAFAWKRKNFTSIIPLYHFRKHL